MDTAIADVETRTYRVPTDEPEADGTLTWDATTVVVVRVRAAGRVGTGWTYAPAAAAAVVDGLLADVVRGRDALAPATAQAAMVRAVRNAGRPGLVSMAISAVDIAVWDLCARIHDLPLTVLWGAEPTEVPVYGSGGFTTYDDARTTRQVESWLDAGLDRVKIKIGESWGTQVARDLRRVSLVADLVGEHGEVFVDANGGYTVGQARRVGRRLDELGVTWFEEPVSSDDVAGLAEVRRSVQCDVAAGEYGFDLPYFGRMAAARAVDCLQVDVTRCGGYTEWFRIAAAAAAQQLDVSGHCAPFLTAPAAAATPNLRHLEYFHDHVRAAELLLDDRPTAADGTLALASGPGHGLAVGDAAERYRES